MSSVEQYDAIVLGGGSALSGIASPAAKEGKKICLIEMDKLGGTCLNRGCIPSKMLLYPSELLSEMRELNRFPLLEKHPSLPDKFDGVSLVKSVNSYTDKASGALEKKYQEGSDQVTFYHDKAHFVDTRTLQVGQHLVSAPLIFLGCGADPAIPPIEGIKDVPYLTSTEALHIREIPKKLLIIGGGYIGCELGFFFQCQGSQVEQFEVLPSLLSEEDKDVSRVFSQTWGKYATIHLKVKIKNVSQRNDGKILLRCTKGEEDKELEAEGDAILVATGSSPSTKDLKLEKTQVECSEKGFIKVGPHLNTTCHGIYALGDCVGNYFFRHSANFEANYLLENILLHGGKNPPPIEYPPIAHAVFTHPQAAGVGKTEQQLIDEQIPYFSSTVKFNEVPYGKAMRDEEGFLKLLVSKTDRSILGCHTLGKEAGTMIHIVVALMTSGGGLESLLKMIYVHPTLPEVLRDAARNIRKKFVENSLEFPTGLEYR